MLISRFSQGEISIITVSHILRNDLALKVCKSPINNTRGHWIICHLDNTTTNCDEEYFEIYRHGKKQNC